MTIKLGTKSAIIILLSVCLFLVGLYRYRDWRMEQAAQRIEQTQELLSAVRFPPEAAKAFRQLGWQVRETMPPAAEKEKP